MHIVLITSNSADPVLYGHNSRESAVERVYRLLTAEGWPSDAARAAADKGSPVIMSESGDDDEVRIVEVKAHD